MAGEAQVIANLNAWHARTAAAVVALAQNWAAQMEASAKQNARWTDRTSHARHGLFGTVEVRGNRVFILLGHSVDYGVFLELAHDGRYAILKPTIDAAVPEIYRTYQRLFTP